MPTAEDGSVAAPAGMTFETGATYTSQDMEHAVEAGATPPQVVAVDVDAGQNLNQAAGTLTTSAPVSITGDPSRVELSVNIHGSIPNNVSRARAAAVMELRRGGTLLATAATGYIRDASGHEESSYHFSFVDTAPGTDPVYTITTRRDSNQSGTVGCQAPSTIQAVAHF